MLVVNWVHTEQMGEKWDRMAQKALVVAFTLPILLHRLVLCAAVLTESCSNESSLRLSPTASISSPARNVGRVEVCWRGTWGAIALEGERFFWHEKTIQVACRQLGFSGGLNSIPPVNIPDEDKLVSGLSIHFGDMVCTGDESFLTNCSKSMFSSSFRNPVPSTHHSDVFIVCRPKEQDYSEIHVAGEQFGDVRLFGSMLSGQGAVEIFTNIGWTGICPDTWSGSSANVICQALGYDFGIAYALEVADSAVSRLIHDGRCSDIENTDSSRVQAKMCSFREIVEFGDCPVASNNSYAAVSCNERDTSAARPIRLFGQGEIDEERAVGVLEVYQDGRWGMVCASEDTEVGGINAAALCRGFLFSNVMDPKQITLPTTTLRAYESNLKPLWSSGFHCADGAFDANDCSLLEPLGFSNCTSQHILALDCGPTVVEVHREGNTTAIIVGVLAVAFVFVLVFFIFGTVLYKLLCRKHATATIAGSFEMSAGDLPRAPNAGEVESEMPGGGGGGGAPCNLSVYGYGGENYDYKENWGVDKPAEPAEKAS